MNLEGVLMQEAKSRLQVDVFQSLISLVGCIGKIQGFFACGSE
jgi:hypothetical protein